MKALPPLEGLSSALRRAKVSERPAWVVPVVGEN